MCKICEAKRSKAVHICAANMCTYLHAMHANMGNNKLNICAACTNIGYQCTKMHIFVHISANLSNICTFKVQICTIGIKPAAGLTLGLAPSQGQRPRQHEIKAYEVGLRTYPARVSKHCAHTHVIRGLLRSPLIIAHAYAFAHVKLL